MLENQSDAEYARDISDDDVSLGFERIEIPRSEEYGGGFVPVLARILSSSDILVKTFDYHGGVQYAHRRWGYSRLDSTIEDLDWNPLEPPFSFDEAAHFLQEYDFVSHDSPLLNLFGGIVGVKFEYHRL
jgi:hypothetical protein